MTPYADTATYTVLQNEHIMNSDARICYDNFVLETYGYTVWQISVSMECLQISNRNFKNANRYFIMQYSRNRNRILTHSTRCVHWEMGTGGEIV